jgi:hypothetical protein
MASPHMGGAAHSSPSFSAPGRTFTPPSGPLFSQSGHPGHPPSGEGHRPGTGYRERYPYFYGSYPGLSPFGYGLPLAYGLSYGDDQGDANGPAPQQADYRDSTQEAPGPQVAGNAPPAFRPVYQGPYQSPYQGPYQGPVADAPVHAQPVTTLIYKDGRAPAKVHNYALTSTTLYALDGESRQEIPLALLNIPATVDANRIAGVDFALPVNR